MYQIIALYALNLHRLYVNYISTTGKMQIQSNRKKIHAFLWAPTRWPPLYQVFADVPIQSSQRLREVGIIISTLQMRKRPTGQNRAPLSCSSGKTFIQMQNSHQVIQASTRKSLNSPQEL